MTERIFARQFHATEGVEAWRVLPEGAYAFFRTELVRRVRPLRGCDRHAGA